MEIDQLLDLMCALGLSTDGVETQSQALTRLSSAVYSAEV